MISWSDGKNEPDLLTCRPNLLDLPEFGGE